jgi:carbon storage regulator
MLVLSRRVGEQIVIGEDIRITVVAVQGNKVRIGVSAPPTVTVDRQEVNVRRGQWSASPWSRKSAPDDSRLPDLSRAN